MEEDFGGPKMDTKVIQNYIDQQMSKKLGILKQDLDEMVDNFQLEMIRQFQIQRGTVENLLNDYMIDEDSFLQEEVLDDKYLDSEDEAPDYIYLQED